MVELLCLMLDACLLYKGKTKLFGISKSLPIRNDLSMLIMVGVKFSLKNCFYSSNCVSSGCKSHSGGSEKKFKSMMVGFILMLSGNYIEPSDPSDVNS